MPRGGQPNTKCYLLYPGAAGKLVATEGAMQLATSAGWPGMMSQADIDAAAAAAAGGAGASSTSDPYIMSANGKITKTPDRHGFYRLFENGDMFINAEVDELDISKALTAFLESKDSNMAGAGKVIDRGFWNKAIYIESEGRSISYNLFKNEATSRHAGSYFKVSAVRQPRRATMDGIPVDDVVTASITISWNHSVHGKQSVVLDQYENPQVQNGMAFNSALLLAEESIGMLVKNYKAKCMSLGSLTVGECGKLRKRLQKKIEAGASVTHEKPIQAKDEAWFYARDGRVAKR